MWTCIFQHVLIGAGREQRRIIDRINRDRKRQRRRGIVTAVGCTAVVLDLYIERGRAVGVSRGCVRQIAAGIHAGHYGEETSIADVTDRVGEHALSRLIRRAGIERCPAVDRLGTCIFIDRRWIRRGQGWFVIHGIHRDRHRREVRSRVVVLSSENEAVGAEEVGSW